MLLIPIYNLILATAQSSPTDGTASSIAEEIYSILNTVVEHWKIITSVVGLVGIVLFLLYSATKCSFLRPFADVLIKDKADVKYDYKSYIKHNFYFNKDKKEKISYREFNKRIKDKKNVILVATAGVGKTMLMQRLAFKFRYKFFVKNIFSQIANKEKLTLEDYGIIYFSCFGKNDLTILKEKISKLKDGKSNKSYTIMIDGIDDLSCINGKQFADDIITDFYDFIKEKNIICTRIIMSLRPETLRDGNNFLINGLNIVGSTNYQPQFFELCLFDKKQALGLYIKQSKRDKEDKTTRTRNKDYLSKIIDASNSKESSLFLYPFIVSQMSYILQDIKEKDIKKIAEYNLYEILQKIVEKYIEREFKRYKSSFTNLSEAKYYNHKNKKDSSLYRDAMLKLMKSVAKAICKGSVIDISRNEIEKLANELKIEDERAFSHSLLVYVADSEMDSLDNKPKYKFIHNYIYWFLLAEMRVDKEIDIRDFWQSIELNSEDDKIYRIIYSLVLQYVKYKNISSKKLDVWVLFIIGSCYYKGWGTEKDLTKAFEYCKKAAEQGLSIAQFNLAVCYANGWGTEKDPTKAFEYYTKVAKQGLSIAQYNLAVCYANGEGTEKDLNEAFKYYKLAAKQGLSIAQYDLAVCYANGEGTEKDLNEAFKYYKLAADQGLAEAQYNLAVCYEKGEGTKKDLTKAFEYYTKAAKQGDAYAQNSLAACYENGKGTEKDLTKAFEYYTKAAEQGLSIAPYNLAVCYANGWGAKKDSEKTFEYFKLAVDQGFDFAQYSLEIYYEISNDTPKKIKEYFKYLEQGAKQGDAEAQYRLAICYANSFGIEKRDFAKAFEYCKKSANQGYSNAQVVLAFFYRAGIGTDVDLQKAEEYESMVNCRERND